MDPTLLNHWWSLLAAVCYALATWFIHRDLEISYGRAGTRTGVVLALGAGSHAFTLVAALFTGGIVIVGIGTALSLTAWVVVLLYLAALWRQPLATLGLIVVPLALGAVLLAWVWSGPAVPLAHLSASAIVHSLASVTAFGFLALAFCQAVVLLLQEWHLQNKRAGRFFHSLPPLQTMERILFQVITLGFALLTIALLSGVVFSNEIFGRPLTFTHHVVLSILAWLAFGTLLLGRRVLGWRGRTAATWTIASFALLTLAYFGTRFVLEVVLGRH